MDEKKILLIGIVLLIAGLLIAVLATIDYNTYNNAIENDEVTLVTARVTDTYKRRVYSSSDTRTRYEYTDTFEYKVDGLTYTGSEKTSYDGVFRTAPNSYQVYYYNDNPISYFILSDSKPLPLIMKWFIPTIGLGIVVYSELKRRMII